MIYTIKQMLVNLIKNSEIFSVIFVTGHKSYI